ncbi:MAG: ABC transporter ATP-binding protein/permease [Clostridia bacterium]|nr:ABC transporter ATP-binding protein/permease [Clostridia bacterium]
MLKRFVSYYKPHLFLFILDMLASLLISVVGMVYPVMTNRMLNQYIPNREYRSIIIAGSAVLGLYAVRMLLRYFVQYQGHMVGTRMQAQMRRELFAHLEELPFSFFDSHETGAIMSRLTGDLFEVSELAHHGPENILTSSVMIVLSFGYLCSIDVPLTLIIFICAPILVSVSVPLRKKMRKAFTERREANARINAAVESSVTGIRVTKAYVNSETEKQKFESGNDAFVRASAHSYKAMGIFHSSTSFVTDVFNVFILIAGGLFLYSGRINFGEYSTFIVSVNLFISPVQTLIAFMEQWQNGVTGFRRFAEIMDIPAEEDAPGAAELTDLSGDIALENVTFAYDGTDGRDALENISLTVPGGSRVALVGPSGGGKTTICHLIPAFYRLEPGCGRITIGGTDVAGVTLGSLRRGIGIVQQDVFLFSGSVADNIRYGRPDATDDEVVRAAKAAKIHDFIMTLPDGYSTDIGERGVRLSGGQKQRLSIARLFLKDPRILILDEATSALDNTTELQIQQALDELSVGRTTIVVAHRLSTIRNADRIFVIDSGRVAESGTHAELLSAGGKYAELHRISTVTA